MPGNASITYQKSSILDHFWYLFGGPGPPWGASGSQCDNESVPESTFRRFLMDIGDHWPPLLNTVGAKAGQKAVLGHLFGGSGADLENMSKTTGF